FHHTPWWTTATSGPKRIYAISGRRAGSISIPSWRTRSMPEPGDVVTVDFVGATGIKRRPAVVVSSRLYHAHRPDVILAVLTTQVTTATTPTDYVLQDWAAAGLRRPSAFRAYLGMATPDAVHVIGHLSARDWGSVQACLTRALAIPEPPSP